ncbi:head-tail joining protein [Marinibacterium sp. SX1]|uniref:head-tail joining protein n=1 Tax=Marinibacterium sp. SX1 TaxID=3388424 RepID=UPI003D176953
MTGLFDGLASVILDTLGDDVTVSTEAHGDQVIQAKFREQPIEVTDGEGHTVLIVAPTLWVSRAVLDGIRRDDLVMPAITPGRTFRVVNVQPSGSPGADALIVCELEEEFA